MHLSPKYPIRGTEGICGFAIREATQDGGRLVGRPIVHDDDFVHQGRSQKSVEDTGQRLFLVVCIDNGGAESSTGGNRAF